MFFDVESESEIHFSLSEPETLDNPGKNSGLSRVFGTGRRKWKLNFDFT